MVYGSNGTIPRYIVLFYPFKIIRMSFGLQKRERGTQCDCIIAVQYNLTRALAQESTRATSVTIKKLRSTAQDRAAKKAKEKYLRSIPIMSKVHECEERRRNSIHAGLHKTRASNRMNSK